MLISKYMEREEYEKAVKLFGIADFSAYTAHFQLAVIKKDTANCITVLKPMLAAMVNTGRNLSHTFVIGDD